MQTAIQIFQMTSVAVGAANPEVSTQDGEFARAFGARENETDRVGDRADMAPVGADHAPPGAEDTGVDDTTGGGPEPDGPKPVGGDAVVPFWIFAQPMLAGAEVPVTGNPVDAAVAADHAALPVRIQTVGQTSWGEPAVSTHPPTAADQTTAQDDTAVSGRGVLTQPQAGGGAALPAALAQGDGVTTADMVVKGNPAAGSAPPWQGAIIAAWNSAPPRPDGISDAAEPPAAGIGDGDGMRADASAIAATPGSLAGPRAYGDRAAGTGLPATVSGDTEPDADQAAGEASAADGPTPAKRPDMASLAALASAQGVAEGIRQGGLPGAELALPPLGSLAAAASLPTAGAGPTAMPPIVAQILPALAPGSGTTEIALSPEELGHVRLSFQPHHSDPDRIVVMMSFERPDVMDLFRRNADQLQADLRAAGYSGADLSFAQSNSGDRPQHDPPNMPGRGGPLIDAPATMFAPVAARQTTTSSLDLRL